MSPNLGAGMPYGACSISVSRVHVLWLPPLGKIHWPCHRPNSSILSVVSETTPSLKGDSDTCKNKAQLYREPGQRALRMWHQDNITSNLHIITQTYGLNLINLAGRTCKFVQYFSAPFSIHSSCTFIFLICILCKTDKCVQLTECHLFYQVMPLIKDGKED